MDKVFLDYGSCHPVHKSILDKLPELASNFYNASSTYEFGIENKREIEKVRKKVADLINADPSEIYFVRSASEGNTLCIDGFLKRHSEYDVICSGMEHSSIYDNPNIDYVIPYDEFGRIDIEEIKSYKQKSLFAIMHSSNELGIINPIREIADIIHRRGSYLLCDAASSFGKVPIDVKELGVDFLTASGNKIGSLKGVGFVYIRDGIDIAPIIIGTQEDGLVGGTYNELAIKTLGMAIDELKPYGDVYANTLYLVNRLENIDDVYINSFVDGLPNLVNIFIRNIGINAQQIVSLLDDAGFIVSSGSACHNGVNKPSHVLKAIGLNDYEVVHSIRITIGHETTVEELDSFVDCLKNIINMNKI